MSEVVSISVSKETDGQISVWLGDKLVLTSHVNPNDPASLQQIVATVRDKVNREFDARRLAQEIKNAALVGPHLQCLADVKPEPVRWLWESRIPLGRISLLVGMPGWGKSFLTTDLAARVSTGNDFPDGRRCRPGSVILVSGEDDPADTIRPRLDAHKADARRIHLLQAVNRIDAEGRLQQGQFSLNDLPALEEAVGRVDDCRLLVIDPIGSFLGSKTDAHRDNEVRAVLAPVASLASQRGFAVVVVAHRRKGESKFADDVVLGSRAFTGIARVVWHLLRDPENADRRLLLPGKNNLAPEGTGLAFWIDGVPPAICWEPDPVEMTADEALAAEAEKGKGQRGPTAHAETAAVGWLQDALGDGRSHPVKDLKAAAKEACLSWRNVERAGQKLCVESERHGFGGGFAWRMPTIPANLPKGEKLGGNGEIDDFLGKTGGFESPRVHSRQVSDLGGNDDQPAQLVAPFCSDTDESEVVEWTG